MSETITIPMSFKNHNKKDVKVSEEVFEKYINEFADKYTDKIDRYFRIGKSSKNIIFQGRMYGEIAEFAASMPSAKVLEKSILELNQDLEVHEVGYSGWLSLDEYILSEFKDEIKAIIEGKHTGVDQAPETELNTKTYKFNGEDVVFFMFENPSSGNTMYAVPVEIAKKLNLEDYDGEEISQYEDFLDEIEPFALEHIYSYNTD